MPIAALLALLAIAMLMLAALRLELNFRRNLKTRPTPQLRIAPAGGYWNGPDPSPKCRSGLPA